MIKKAWFELILSLLGILLLFFIAAPVAKLIFGVEPQVLIDTVKEEEVYSSILLTFSASLVATLISILLGVPLAYLLARRDFFGKSFVESLIDIPVIIPHTAAGIALLTVFGRNFFLGRFFSIFRIEFVGEFAGIVIAMMFVSMPFLTNEFFEFIKLQKKDYDVLVPEYNSYLEPLAAVYSKKCLPFINASLKRNQLKMKSFFLK